MFSTLFSISSTALAVSVAIPKIFSLTQFQAPTIASTQPFTKFTTLSMQNFINSHAPCHIPEMSFAAVPAPYIASISLYTITIILPITAIGQPNVFTSIPINGSSFAVRNVYRVPSAVVIVPIAVISCPVIIRNGEAAATNNPIVTILLRALSSRLLNQSTSS